MTGRISQIQEKVFDICREAVIIDSLFAMDKFPKDPSCFEEMRQAGVTAVCASIVGAEDVPNYEVMQRISSCYQGFEKYSDIIIPVTTSKDIEIAKKQNKVGIILGFQTTKPIENNVDFLDLFHRLGIRVMQLTYQRKNWVGDGCGERTDCGLSRFGIEVIKRLNKLGILVDVSHCGPKTTMEAIKISEKPIAFTHANPRALCNVVRNKTDEQIKALAEKGGVMSLTVLSGFCKRSGNATSNDFLHLIDYVINIAGVEHVGLGFDFAPFFSKDDWTNFQISNPEIAEGLDYETRYVKGMESARCLPELIKGLVNRGYSEEKIKKILGGNNLNLFKEVWGA